MKKEKFFSCLDCHQEIISSKKEIKKCPKCGEKFVIEVKPYDLLNFRINAVIA